MSACRNTLIIWDDIGSYQRLERSTSTMPIRSDGKYFTNHTPSGIPKYMKIHLHAYPCITPMFSIPLLHTVLPYTSKTPAYFASTVISRHGRHSRQPGPVGKTLLCCGRTAMITYFKLNISQRHKMETLLYTKCLLYVYDKYNTCTWRRNEVICVCIHIYIYIYIYIYIHARYTIITLSKINTGSRKTKQFQKRYIQHDSAAVTH